MARFLILHIDQSEGGIITLTQIDLVDQLLQVISMENSKIKFTQSEKEPATKDIYGDPYCEEWDYRAVVGMILYLVDSSIPYISYVVHQRARFLHSPIGLMRWC